MKTKESESKMWYWWIVGVIIVIVLGIGIYFAYQKYNSLDALNAKIAEKDSIIATQQTIVESNQKIIESNNKEISLISTRYRKLKDALEKAAKANEAIQKPVGESNITNCLDRHGFSSTIKK